MKNLVTPILLLLTMLLMVACSIADTTDNGATAVASAAKTMPAVAVAKGTIYGSAEETEPLPVGAVMPAFSVQAVDGSFIEFSAGERAKPAVIITYRGGWCPFCNVHLSALQELVPALTEKGMEVFFFSGDRPEILYSGLKDEAKEVSQAKEYVIYSDANAAAARALGIAFKLPEKQLARMIDSPIVDAAGGSLARHGVLSVPSVFIIGTSGKVEFVHADPDYKVRISNEDLKQAAMAVLGQ